MTNREGVFATFARRRSGVRIPYSSFYFYRQRMQERIGTVSAEVLNAMFEELGKLMGCSV
jgi:hypothetical protein